MGAAKHRVHGGLVDYIFPLRLKRFRDMTLVIKHAAVSKRPPQRVRVGRVIVPDLEGPAA